ncbi:sigma-54-dependent Fis family transcriptional regulator [Fibrobacterales bacterium]|nr:sigma-54-dependent Fis family transcriptional regulator [Fibrobacterales bacterium]
MGDKQGKVNSVLRGEPATEIQFLHRISTALAKSENMDEVLQLVLHELGLYWGMKYATISLFNRVTGNLSIELASGLSPMQISRGHYKVGEGVTGRVAATGEPAVIPRTSTSEEFLNRTGRSKDQDTSFICVPIFVEQEVVGTLSVDKDCEPPNELQEDMHLLSVVAALITQAVKFRLKLQSEMQLLRQENEQLRTNLAEKFKPSNMIGNSAEMQLVYDQIAKVAKSPSTVFILGETGTGKELVAEAIHFNSDRAGKPFVRVHCAALPENIIESELFGHERGAFTGAIGERKGRFELADSGTIFLDEISEISPNLQVKLLRVLQERAFERVGGTKTISVNIRIIAAANKDLLGLVREGKFREDLYYRLHVFPIFVPPLRKRKSDITLLADYFIEKYNKIIGKRVTRLSSSAIDMFMSYHWAGNVRELENCIERAVLVAEGEVIYPHNLPATLQTAETTGKIVQGDLKTMVDTYERDIIVDTLKSCGGNIAATARTLQTTQRILGYKIKVLGIDPKKY